MLGHLLSFEPEPLPLLSAASLFVDDKDAQPVAILGAKINTEQWLRNMGAEQPTALDPAYEAALAAQAFGAVSRATPAASQEEVKKHVLALRTPEAVQKITGMLTAYEWNFVDEAQKIRSYIVAGLVKETEDKKAEVRLKAYKLLGEVTEVALFTQRTEIVTRDLSDEQIQAEINKRLERLTLNPDTPLVTRIDTEVDDA
jgi:hypothetical protein